MVDVKQVYTIINKEGLEKGQWVKIGVGFINRDQSLNIRLDALPVNGLLHVRSTPRKPRKPPTEKNALG